MRRKKRYFSRGMLTVLAAVFAFLFLMPTVLTITNSFMTQSEITANYGQVFQNATDGKSYIKDKINLKFIPDKVSFTQYFTVLLKSPDFLYKFWNSVILVAPLCWRSWRSRLSPPTASRDGAARSGTPSSLPTSF